MADLSTRIASIPLHTPLLTASGTAGYGVELARYGSLKSWGGIVGKSISREPRQGNPYPRTAETPAGMLNAIGLQNEGWESFSQQTLPAMRELTKEFDTKIIVNIVGHELEEYVWLAERLNDQPDVAGVELNLSCPNVKAGLRFSTEPQACEELISQVKKVLKLPLIAKLSPNVTNIGEIARGAEAGGADALSLINTLVGMAIDWRAKKTLLTRGIGGLSGPAVKPVALRCVFQAAQAVDIPVIGIGGIHNADDVLEFIVAGASAIQIGTMLFVEPDIGMRILKELEEKLEEAKVERLSDLTGTLQLG